jgi:hypothetical protein
MQTPASEFNQGYSIKYIYRGTLYRQNLAMRSHADAGRAGSVATEALHVVPCSTDFSVGRPLLANMTTMVVAVEAVNAIAGTNRETVGVKSLVTKVRLCHRIRNHILEPYCHDSPGTILPRLSRALP